MADRYPRLFKVTLVIMTGVAVLAGAWAFSVQSDPVMFAAFVIATAVLQTGPARIRDDVGSSLMMISIFTAMVVGGAALAVLSVLGYPFVLAWQVKSRRLAKALYNYGQFTVAAGTGGLLYQVLAPAPGTVQGLMTLRGVSALAIAGLVATVVNHVFVALALRLTVGDRVSHSLQGVIGSALLLQFFYLGFSVVAAALILEVHAVTLILLVVPALIARQGLLGFQAQARAYDELVSAFVKVIEVKDPYTRGHADRVATLSEAVAGELGFDYDTRRVTRYAAVLHDVGKVAIPSEIINKPGALDDAEREIIKRHPRVGAEMLRDITFLQPAIDIVRFHHERLDGCGYPYAVGADELSPLVRIVTAVDAFDAMTSTRSYRRALDVEEAIRELRRHAGTQFDGEVVEALAVIVAKLGWQPTLAFASEQELAACETRRTELETTQYGSSAGVAGATA
jgi:putative nucleotidyltransferase with HDIG domain